MKRVQTSAKIEEEIYGKQFSDLLKLRQTTSGDRRHRGPRGYKINAISKLGQPVKLALNALSLNEISQILSMPITLTVQSMHFQAVPQDLYVL
jgi:hypothetical protein